MEVLETFLEAMTVLELSFVLNDYRSFKIIKHVYRHIVCRSGLVKRDFASKVCSLLVDGGIGKGKSLNQYQVYKYRYDVLRKRNPKAIFTLERQLRTTLEDARMLLEQL